MHTLLAFSRVAREWTGEHVRLGRRQAFERRGWMCTWGAAHAANAARSVRAWKNSEQNGDEVADEDAYFSRYSSPCPIDLPPANCLPIWGPKLKIRSSGEFIPKLWGTSYGFGANGMCICIDRDDLHVTTLAPVSPQIYSVSAELCAAVACMADIHTTEPSAMTLNNPVIDRRVSISAA